MNSPWLSTSRLRLRAFTLADAPALAAYRTDPDVAAYQGWTLPYTLADAEAMTREMEGKVPGDGGWVQVALSSLDAVGLLGDLALNTDGPQAEVGITLARAAQGQGYAAEALRALLDHTFGPLGLHRVHAAIDPRNTAVARLLTRLGFRHEGTHIRSYRHRGAWTDEAVYAVLGEEWSGGQTVGEQTVDE